MNRKNGSNKALRDAIDIAKSTSDASLLSTCDSIVDWLSGILTEKQKHMRQDR